MNSRVSATFRTRPASAAALCGAALHVHALTLTGTPGYMYYLYSDYMYSNTIDLRRAHRLANATAFAEHRQLQEHHRPASAPRPLRRGVACSDPDRHSRLPTSFNYYTNTIDLHLLPAAKLEKANSLESSGGTLTCSTTTIRLRSTGAMPLPRRHPCNFDHSGAICAFQQLLQLLQQHYPHLRAPSARGTTAASPSLRDDATASQLLPTLRNLFRQAAAAYSGRESFIV